MVEKPTDIPAGKSIHLNTFFIIHHRRALVKVQREHVLTRIQVRVERCSSGVDDLSDVVGTCEDALTNVLGDERSAG